MRRKKNTNWSNVKKTISNLVATFFFIGGMLYWYEIMRFIIVPNSPQNIAFLITSTLVCAGGPPALLSMVIPWSPLGKWMSREFLKTWGGFIAVILLFAGLGYYFEMSYQWWYHQAANEYSLLVQQVIIGFIGFYIVPAISMQSYRSPDVLEQMEHARAVERVESVTENELQRLRHAMMVMSQLGSKTKIGTSRNGRDIHDLSRLSQQDRVLLMQIFTELLKDYDSNLREFLRSAGEVTSLVIPFGGIFVERPELVELHAQFEEILLALPEGGTKRELVEAAKENPALAGLLEGLLGEDIE